MMLNREYSTTSYEISKNDMIKEYEHIWGILEENFSYYLEILSDRGYNLEEIKAKYRKRIEQASDFDEYYSILDEFLNNEFKGEGHLMLCQPSVYLGALKGLEYLLNDPENGDFTINGGNENNLQIDEFINSDFEFMFKVFYDKDVKDRYQMLANRNEVKLDILEKESSPAKYHQNDFVKFFSHIGNRTLFIKYDNFALENVHKNTKLIEEKLKEIPYENIIVDIRGNGGGTTLAWKNLVSLIIDTDIEWERYYLAKGDLSSKYTNQILKDDKVNKKQIDTNEYIYTITDKVISSKNKMNKVPDVYILTDDKVFSAANSFLKFAKETGFASIIGTMSGKVGAGIGDPISYILPKSKLIIRFHASIQCDEFGMPLDTSIKPDIFVNPYISYDECIELIKSN